MKLIALCGTASAGKDTVADMLPARKLAFADALYREVAEAWGVPVAVLKCRATKELSAPQLHVNACSDDDFVVFCLNRHCVSGMAAESFVTQPRSPRQILQWWGDYRRAQDPDYFVKRTHQEIIDWDWATPGGAYVLTDVRFPNEAALVRQLGGQLWQIRRPGYEAGGTGHASDTAGDEFEPDEIMWNQGTLEDLRLKVAKYWEAV